MIRPLRGSGELGFTLLELMVVLVLLALVVAMVAAAPAPGRLHGEATAAVHQVATALRQARSDALAESREVAFTLDVVQGRYRVGSRGNASLPAGVTLVLDTMQSEQIDRTTGSIRFFPDGSSTGGRVTLVGEHGEAAVIVHWLTGRVTIDER